MAVTPETSSSGASRQVPLCEKELTMETAKCSPVSFQRNRVSTVTNDSALNLSASHSEIGSRFVACLANASRPLCGRIG